MKTVDRKDPEWQRNMTRALTRTLGHDSSKYFQQLYDTVQSHALYGIGKDEVESHKEQLKKLGANKFRVVTATSKYFKILCFNATKIQLS